MATNALIPIEQKEISFYDDQVAAVRLDTGDVYIPIKPICEAMGLSWAGQRQRIQRHAVMKNAVKTVKLDRTNSSGGNPNVMCIPLEHLNGWLFGINAERVKPELRESLVRYQTDCFKVLSDAFGRNQVTARPLSVDVEELLQHSDDPTAVAYRHALALVNLAREQMMFKVEVEGRINSAEARIDAIEAELGNPDRLITQSQQMQISQAVKAVAYELGNRSGRNEFGGVWGELYRRFEISSYKQLPAAKHAEATNFLSDWYSQLTGAELPF